MYIRYTDLYTMLPQEESLNILTEFLLQHGYNKVKGVPIDCHSEISSYRNHRKCLCL